MRIGVEVVARGRITRDARRVADVAVEIVQADAVALTGSLKFVIPDRVGAEQILGGPLPEGWVRFSR